MVCVISGGILGGPNPISSEYNFENKNLNIEEIRKSQRNFLHMHADLQELIMGHSDLMKDVCF